MELNNEVHGKDDAVKRAGDEVGVGTGAEMENEGALVVLVVLEIGIITIILRLPRIPDSIGANRYKNGQGLDKRRYTDVPYLSQLHCPFFPPTLLTSHFYVRFKYVYSTLIKRLSLRFPDTISVCARASGARSKP